VNDARLAGLLDWEAIEDRTREVVRQPHWDSGKDILTSVAAQFQMDHWDNQESRVYVIVEKEALAGILGVVCRKWDVPLLAARGYPSGTVLREFAIDDIIPALHSGQCPVILHLGDHDPSGIDMSRDLKERLQMFCRDRLDFQRIALNHSQIDEHKPPPNPAKSTDSRFGAYRKKFGTKSWELDALEPKILSAIVESHIEASIDPFRWDERTDVIESVKAKLHSVAKRFKD
jgi:hypothetical protein